MDAIDRRILRLLQADATLPVAEIAHRVGLTQTPCWKRIRKLEAQGILRARVALVDPAAVGAGVTVFMAVRVREHSAEWLDRFARAVDDMPEVVEFYRMSGEVDYLLRVVVPDIAAYDAFYKRLIARVPLGDVTSSFAMERIKYTTELPIAEPETPPG